MGFSIEEEISVLTGHIKRLGQQQDEGIQVTFKELFDDDSVANTLESLAGTLKAAKRKKIVSYKAELLLQGMSDKEVITLKEDN